MSVLKSSMPVCPFETGSAPMRLPAPSLAVITKLSFFPPHESAHVPSHSRLEQGCFSSAEHRSPSHSFRSEPLPSKLSIRTSVMGGRQPIDKGPCYGRMPARLYRA